MYCLFYFTSENSTGVWNSLIRHVSTRYVLIARDVSHFSWHSRLERLVREITDLDASVAAGAHRDLKSGVVGMSTLYNSNFPISLMANSLN